MKQVQLYTDGACEPNGNGGWGFVLRYEGIAFYRTFGWEKHTTNNRMELTAIIKGLEALKEPCMVNVFSDSQYVVGAFQDGYIHKWKNDLFAHTKNADLWRRLLKLKEQHDVNFVKVCAHSGDRFNEMADNLAKQGLKQGE